VKKDQKKKNALGEWDDTGTLPEECIRLKKPAAKGGSAGKYFGTVSGEELVGSGLWEEGWVI